MALWLIARIYNGQIAEVAFGRVSNPHTHSLEMDESLLPAIGITSPSETHLAGCPSLGGTYAQREQGEHYKRRGEMNATNCNRVRSGTSRRNWLLFRGWSFFTGSVKQHV